MHPALPEMVSILLNVKPGYEIILIPSFSLSSAPNAFVFRSATVIFVDIRPDTMNIDEKKMKKQLLSMLE